MSEFNLSVAHYNVLVAPSSLSKVVTHSSTRYSFILDDLLPSMLPIDVFCFNEVSDEFKDLLESSVQEGELQRPGYHSEIISAQTGKRIHYCTILSYLPVLESHIIPLPVGRNALAVLVQKDDETFIVCSIHTESTEEKYPVREQQIAHLCNKLTQKEDFSDVFNRTHEEGRVLIIGDFNFHLPLETETIYKQGYVDIWREVHGGDVGAEDRGVTWDGKKSHYLVFDNRQMRLDRAIMPKKMVGLFPDEISVFAKENVKGHSFLPSDHYGLLVNFTKCPGIRETKPFVKNEREINTPLQTGYRTIPTIVGMRIAAVVCGLGVCVPLLAMAIF